MSETVHRQPHSTAELLHPAHPADASNVEAERAERPEPDVELFAGRGDEYRQRWTDVQSGFVDEPRRAVEEADGLVAQLISHIAETFSEERSRLEERWRSGDEVSTDDLRLVLQRYRSFFNRLLTT